MENVVVAVALVAVFALIAMGGCEWVERELARGWPSRARAWEDIGRRK